MNTVIVEGAPENVPPQSQETAAAAETIVEAASEARVEEIAAETEARVELIEAETAARVDIIAAEADAQEQIIEAQAEAQTQVEEARAENNDTWRMEMMTTLETINNRLTALEQLTPQVSSTAENNSTPISTQAETENPSSQEQALSGESAEQARAVQAPRQRREIFL